MARQGCEPGDERSNRGRSNGLVYHGRMRPTVNGYRDLVDEPILAAERRQPGRQIEESAFGHETTKLLLVSRRQRVR